MNYADLLPKLTDPRQLSLFAILDDAVQCATEANDKVYVINAPIYVDEYAEGVHTYGVKPAIEIMSPNRPFFKAAGIHWEIEAVVSPDSTVFFVKMEDTLAFLTLAAASTRKVNLQVLPFPTTTNLERTQ